MRKSIYFIMVILRSYKVYQYIVVKDDKIIPSYSFELKLDINPDYYRYGNNRIDIYDDQTISLEHLSLL